MMPGLDGTGPAGLGPFSGRGRGYCMLRLPDEGSIEAASGYAGIIGEPVSVSMAGAQPAIAARKGLPSQPVMRRGGCRGGWRGGHNPGRW